MGFPDDDLSPAAVSEEVEACHSWSIAAVSAVQSQEEHRRAEELNYAAATTTCPLTALKQQSMTQLWSESCYMQQTQVL